MNTHTILINLYYLLIHADGKINEKEIALGHEMMITEGIPENVFHSQLESLKSRDLLSIYDESLNGLRSMTHEQQINNMAWLCIIANSDGFMDRTEWNFIYNIYHRELHLSLEEIMRKQRELGHLTHSNSGLSQLFIA